MKKLVVPKSQGKVSAIFQPAAAPHIFPAAAPHIFFFKSIFLAGKARIYDQYMEKQRNDKFFASLKNQKPVYRVKDWEDSYKVQVRITVLLRCFAQYNRLKLDISLSP